MRMLFVIILLLGLQNKAFATPEFAREFSTDCFTCHTNIPMLNSTGKSFLKNGFKFAQGDNSTLKKILTDKENKHYIPLAIMLSGKYNDQTDDISIKSKLYLGGSITNNISIFGMTKKNFDSNNNQDFFTMKNSRVYLTFNSNNSKHQLRVGLIEPLTMIFPNVDKSSADSGLKGNNSNSNRDQENSNQTQNSGKNRANNNSSHQENNSQHGQEHYKTPMQNSSFSKIRGIEYSYELFDNTTLFLSYGDPVNQSNTNNGNRGKGNQNNSQNQSNHGNYGNQGGHSQRAYGKGGTQNSQNYTTNSTQLNSDNDYQFITGIKLFTDYQYTVAIFYNKYKQKGISSNSLLIPIERDFDDFIYNTNIIYKHNKILNDYFGWENIITYPINDTSYLRGIVNIDQDENSDNNYGYSIGYDKMFSKYLLLHFSIARKDTPSYDDNIFTASLNLFF